MWRRYLVGNPLFLWRVWREVRITHRAARRALVQPGPAGGARRRASLRRSTWRARPALSGSAKRLIDVVGAGLLLLAVWAFTDTPEAMPVAAPTEAPVTAPTEAPAQTPEAAPAETPAEAPAEELPAGTETSSDPAAS